MIYKSREEQDLITRLWHDHAFEWPKEIARLARRQGIKCSSYIALKLYPFERPIGLIRQDQAVRALTMYPGLTNKALERRICISDNTIGKAKQFLAKQLLDADYYSSIKEAKDRLLPRFASPMVMPVTNPEPAPSHVTEHAAEHAAEHVAELPPTEDTYIGDVLQQRGAIYGHPLDNFRNIAEGSKIIAQCPDQEVRVALNLVWVKVCRLIKSPDHLDSIRDIAGYAGTIEMLHMERKRRS